MAFQVSPGVNITEIDRTGVVTQISTTTAGFVGDFKWGPVEQIVTVDSENALVSEFGKPTEGNVLSFYSAANFLGYGAALQVVRASNTAVLAAGATGGLTANSFWNDAEYDQLTNYGTEVSSLPGVLCAKYPGILGNSLKISYSDNFDRGITFTALASGAGSNGLTWGNGTLQIGITGADRDNQIDLPAVGDTLKFTPTATPNVSLEFEVTSVNTASEPYTITVSAGGNTAAIQSALTGLQSASLVWKYANFVPYTVGTSSLASSKGYTGDEVAFVVIDEDGLFTGAPGTVLESFIGSKASNAILGDGSNNYYATKLQDSQYTRWISHAASADLNSENTNWGATFAQIGGSGTFKSLKTNKYVSLTGGTDPVVTDGNIYTGYDLFKDTDNVDVSLLLQGSHSKEVGKYIIDLAELRKDCVAFVSPEITDVKDKTPAEAFDNVVDFKKNQLNKNSSYAVLDSGWKYQYDKYYDTFRWMPLNPDIAGLCARTDVSDDPWFSPAGYNRGQIRNVVKLAFNPTKALRDGLYANSINPVISQPGQGTLLFGDKTLLSKPSAFDRINVRRLFIILEKAVATAAKFQLFEFNDEFTRANFLGIVEPFLRDVQARRGITEFKVVCDETNNTAEVIDKNQFVADIYIKPNRSINFIQLNFIATRSNVQFSEVGASITV